MRSRRSTTAKLIRGPGPADLELRAVVEAGASLTDVARALGVSRERIRQRVRRAGLVGPLRRGPRVDDLGVLRALEVARGNRSRAAQATGVSVPHVRRLAVAFGFRVGAQIGLRRRIVAWVVRDLADTHPDRRVTLDDLATALGFQRSRLQNYLGTQAAGRRPLEPTFAQVTAVIWAAAAARRGRRGRQGE